MSTTLVPEPETGFDIPVELHLLGKGHEIVPARIRRVSQALFELNCPQSLPAGQRAALSHEGRRLEVETISAMQVAPKAYLLTVKVLNEELGEVRSELRLPTDLAAKLRVAGEAKQLAVRVVDMSPSGMGIETSKALMPGAKVCVNFEQGLAFGEVRFCQQKSADLYLVGFRLEEYIGQD